MAPRSSTQRARALDAIARWDEVFRRDHAAAALAKDPLQFARRYPAPADRELVALVSALLAFGKITIITRKLDELLARLGPSPAAAVRALPRAALVARPRARVGVVHQRRRAAAREGPQELQLRGGGALQPAPHLREPRGGEGEERGEEGEREQAKRHHPQTYPTRADIHSAQWTHTGFSAQPSQRPGWRREGHCCAIPRWQTAMS